jgi:ferric-dicitrate binding protein FerR (iron transport regulator)
MTDPRIKAEAARWLIELDTAEDAGAVWPHFEAWIRQDDEHRKAYARVERAWHTLEDLRRLYTKPTRDKTLSSTVIIVAIVVAVAAALAVASYT